MSAAAAALDVFLAEVAVKCQFVVDKFLLSLLPFSLPAPSPPFLFHVFIECLYNVSTHGYCRLQWKTKESHKRM